MITCHLMGQLGNTMFEISAAIGTAEKLGVEYAIPSWTYSKNFAGDFNYTEEKLPRYCEPSFNYTEITQDNIELFGYYQSEKYFKHCENKIRKLFAPSNAIAEKIKWSYDWLLKKYNTCSVHVRRGDYLALKDHHYNLETEYYTTIMNMFPDFHYVCFSDDIEWCKQNISAHEFISDSLGVDFHLMSLMRNHIIANSSFSWWASWPNPAKDKMVFAPPKNCWFSIKKAHLNVDDLYCNNWIYKK